MKPTLVSPSLSGLQEEDDARLEGRMGSWPGVTIARIVEQSGLPEKSCHRLTEGLTGHGLIHRYSPGHYAMAQLGDDVILEQRTSVP